MCEIDMDSWDAWAESHPVARKQHRCDCCGARISAGEKYYRISFVYEGTADSEKACLACRFVALGFASEHRWTVNPSAMPEMLRECFEGAGRGDLSDTDRAWRNALAGMIRRKRAAKRETVAHG